MLSFDTNHSKEINVRKNTKDLTREEWDELRRGIALMKERSALNKLDPLGFSFQANIHGWDKYDGSEKANRIADKYSWHRCQHGHYFFLVWHRMYLYHFERILQKITGNSSLAVPYWDYFDPEERSIPEPFRIPADPETNPLYVKQRCRALNQGMPLREEIVNPYPALNTNFFTVDDKMNRFQACHTFGGAEVNRPKLIADKQGLLERIPHDYIHMFVGGPNGFMSDECRTGRDPLFWVHHSQIDRIWESWKEMGGTEQLSDKYLNQTFEFYNPKGVKMSYRVVDFLDITKLNYRYDKLLTGGDRVETKIQKVPEVVVCAKQKNFAKLGIDASQMSVTLDLGNQSETMFERMAKSPEEFENLRFSLQVSFNYIDSQFIYNMYLNLPEHTYPYENKPYFFGSLVYFQAKCVPLLRRDLMNVKKCFDVTDNLKMIIKRNYVYYGMLTKSVNITFVPKSCDNIVVMSDQNQTFIRFNEIHLIHYFSN